MTRQGAIRKATKSKGVYEVISEAKIFKNKPDICFYIAFKVEGKLIWEKIGWLSEGYSEKLAAGIRAERLRSLRHGEELPQQKKKQITFQVLATRYLAWAAGERQNKAVDDINRYEKHLKPRFDSKRLDEITSFDLEIMKSDLMKDGLSPKTISHCLGLVRTMLNRAKDWGLFKGDNPVSKIKMPKIQNERQRFLSHDEAALLLDYLNKPALMQLRDIAIISLFTACRAGEVFALRGCHVNMDNGLVSFVDTKNGTTRHVPINGTIREILKRRKPKDPNDYFFKSTRGEKIKEVSTSFDRAIKTLGFNNGIEDRRQKVVFHSLRHTSLSWAAMEGASLRTLAEMAGHKQLDMVKRYSHLSESHMRDVITGLEKGFKKSQKSKVININERGAK